MLPRKRLQLILYSVATAAAASLFFFFVLLPGLKVDFFHNQYKAQHYKGRIKIQYWDLWTGFEGEAMQRIVDKFNASQDRIWVSKQIISNVDQRFLVSVSGNNAPDIASISQTSIPSFAEKGALLPLDALAREKGLTEDRYIPVFWRMCSYRGHLYALPTVASCLALFYNTKLFRESGLDPSKPPQTIAELDAMAAKLTKYDKNGHLKVLGFSPTDPGWWPQTWAFWFGGNIWNGKDSLTLNSDAYVRAMEWVQSYSKKYGATELENFKSGFGPFASPQNPFISGLVAMELQGVWMPNFIQKYNPKLEYNVAPFPSVKPGPPATLVESNILVIPSNAPHPREAFEFLAFVERPENLEQLCLDQRALPPLRHVSHAFWQKHPNKHIHVFYELARSPNAHTYPQIPIWSQVNDEIFSVFNDIWLLRVSPRKALDALQARMNPLYQQDLARIRLREREETKHPGS